MQRFLMAEDFLLSNMPPFCQLHQLTLHRKDDLWSLCPQALSRHNSYTLSEHHLEGVVFKNGCQQITRQRKASPCQKSALACLGKCLLSEGNRICTAAHWQRKCCCLQWQWQRNWISAMFLFMMQH